LLREAIADPYGEFGKFQHLNCAINDEWHRQMVAVFAGRVNRRYPFNLQTIR